MTSAVAQYNPNALPQTHEVVVKELGKVTEEELAIWERAARVQFLQTFARFVIDDREFYDRVRTQITQEDGYDELSRRDWEWLKELRTKVYTFGNMASLSKIMGPDTDGPQGDLTITVNIGNDAVESDAARRAGARELLSRFSARDKYLESGLEQPILEGTAAVVDKPESSD